MSEGKNVAAEAKNQETSATSLDRFIQILVKKCCEDKGFAARMRRADNPATEYQCWDFLASMGIEIEYENRRLPFATVGAAIAKSDVAVCGNVRLGEAIALCYDEQSQSTQAVAKLRRLLACTDILELCRVLRPLFSLIAARGNKPLDYVRILKQLLRFSSDPQSVKAQWAQEFYRTGSVSVKKGEP